MTLGEFRDWAGNGSVSTPIGTYIGECVSLVQQYLDKVYGIPFQARGHAKDWPSNANVLSHFDKVSSPQAGDIGVSGPTASNPYGHIWVYLSPNQILEQNGRVPRKVSVGPAYSNPSAILRRKGTGGKTMVITRQIAELLTMAITGWPSPMQDGGSFVKSIQGQEVNEATFEKMLEVLLKTDQRRDLINLVNKPSDGSFEEVGNNTGLFQRKKK